MIYGIVTAYLGCVQHSRITSHYISLPRLLNIHANITEEVQGNKMYYFELASVN